jgi:hypothetical protein
MATSTASLGETPRTTAGVAVDQKLVDLERDIVAWTDKLYTTATEDRDFTREVRETTRIIDYLSGKQWGAKQRQSRSRPVLNKVRRHFWENVGLLTDLALDFQVKLFDKLNDFSEFEKILNELCVHWAQMNQFEDRQYDVTLYGLLHTGPSKIQWNSTLHGGMGDVQLVPVAPWQWGTLGAGTNPQDAECIMYFPIVTKEHLIRRFGETARRVECDSEYSPGALQGGYKRPAHVPKETWSRMNNALRTMMGIKQNLAADDTPYPMVMQKEFWINDDNVNERSQTVCVGPADSHGRPRVNWAYMVEPGEKLYPRGRVIVTAGGKVLEDSPNPYWHSKKPFPVFRPFRLPWQMSGDPMMRPWVQMNDVINQILGGMQDYLKGIIEPTLVAPKGAFPAADWDALDPGAAGGKIKYNNNAPKAPEFAKRAEFPLAATKDYVTMIEREFDMSSGASAMQQALNKKQVPGSDSLDAILSSRSLPVRVESRSLASYLVEGGGMVLSDMLQFYSVGHRVAVLGTKGISASDYRPLYGQAIPQGMKPEEFVAKFQGVVKRDTLLASQKESKQQIAFALSKMGKLSDRNLFKILDSNFDYETNLKELLAEAKIKILVAAAGAAAQGKGQKK